MVAPSKKMVKSEEKQDFKPFRQFNPTDPQWSGITYQDLAKPQGLSEDNITEVSSTLTSVTTLGVGTSSPTTTLEVASQTSPQLKISYDITNYATLGVDSTGKLTITPTNSNTLHIGHLLFSPDATYDIGANGATRPKDIYFSDQVRAPSGLVSNPSYAFTIDLTTGWYAGAANDIRLALVGVDEYRFVAAGLINNSANYYGWGSSGVASPDLFLLRDAANSLGLRNGTNAQTFSVYNTYTAGTPDYERLELAWSGNTPILRMTTSGTGTTRALEIRYSNNLAQAAITIPTSSTTPVDICRAITNTSTASPNALRVCSGGGYSGVSGSPVFFNIPGTLSDGGSTSTTTPSCFSITTTINYTAASKTGKVYLQYLNPTFTSLPTGQNGGIVFSSAFTSSTFPAVRLYNTSDEDTNYERLSYSWGLVSANIFGIQMQIGGTGTTRAVTFYYANSSSSALTIPSGTTGIVDLANVGSTGAVATTARVRASNASCSATSGTDIGVLISESWAPTSTSTMVGNSIKIAPTVNYSAGTPGAGKVNLLYLAPTLTSQPTGNNGGLVFSSAFTSSTFPAYLAYNTSDEDTNYERFEQGWHLSSNVYAFRTAKGGTGTTRTMTFLYGNTLNNAIQIPTATTTDIAMAAVASLSSAATNGRVSIGRTGTITATSGAHVTLLVNDAYQPTSTSTMTAYGIHINPTINYSAGTPGAGKVYLMYLAPNNTAMPTGNNGGIVFSKALGSTIPALTFHNAADEDTSYEKMDIYAGATDYFFASSKGSAGTVRPITFKTGGTNAWSIDASQFLFPKASLATNMTTGFLNIVGAAGAPSGVPATTTGFPLYWDSTNLQLYVYTGGAWKKSAVFT